MALAIPKKKKLIILIIIIASLVKDFLNNNESDTPQEQVLRLIGKAEALMNEWGAENGWSTEQQDLWNLIDTISTAHSPEAMTDPDDEDYEGWADSLTGIMIGM